MKIAVVVSILALAQSVHQASGASGIEEQTLTIYIQTDNSPHLTGVLPQAQMLASRMFARVGVRIAWRSGRPKPDAAERPIIIEMRSQTPVGFRPGALASAQEFEGVHISVFSDRVEDACSLRTMPVLLAHVFAHEITHVLEGIDRHSHDGLMKAHWTGRDIAQMASHPLAFDPHDVDLIHKGLAKRGSVVKSLL